MFNEEQGLTSPAYVLSPLRGFRDFLQGNDVVLGAMDASALSGLFDDIDEVGIIRLFDGGRYGEATHAEGADIGGNYGGTDGAVRGHGVGFDVDGGFHGDRSYRTDGTDADVQGLHPWLWSGHPYGVSVCVLSC